MQTYNTWFKHVVLLFVCAYVYGERRANILCTTTRNWEDHCFSTSNPILISRHNDKMTSNPIEKSRARSLDAYIIANETPTPVIDHTACASIAIQWGRRQWREKMRPVDKSRLCRHAIINSAISKVAAGEISAFRVFSNWWFNFASSDASDVWTWVGLHTAKSEYRTSLYVSKIKYGIKAPTTANACLSCRCFGALSKRSRCAARKNVVLRILNWHGTNMRALAMANTNYRKRWTKLKRICEHQRITTSASANTQPT